MTTNSITFLYELFPNLTGIYVYTNYKPHLLHYFDSLDVCNFLKTLGKDKIYVVSPELINLSQDYVQGEPVLTLSDPFVITKESNPDLISDYLLNQMIKAFAIYSVGDNQFNNFKILIKYSELNQQAGLF